MKRSKALIGVAIAGLFVLDSPSVYSGLQAGLTSESPAMARGSAKEEGPSPDLFRVPPIEARPGAFWDWLNGNVDLAQITRELEEMKAKGMSGAEIWDIGTYNQNPDEAPIRPGPSFMGPESLKAINHAIDEATRLGLNLGIVSASSWNAGGSWVKPADAMKGLYSSQTTVTGPSRFSQKLPFPENKAPKGPGGMPVYSEEVAVLACPQPTNGSISDPRAILDLSSKMDADGLLKWDVPPGKWVVMRFVCTNTGQRLMVPSPNSNGLLIDHFSAPASENHFEYLIREILKTRKGLDALKYMEVDSVEIDEGIDWTGNFVKEFRRRRGYDAVPYLPVLKGSAFVDPQIAERFSYDYRKTVSDLWIDGHYRKSKQVLNKYGLQLVAEGGHGGYPRAEPLMACGVVDVPRGEFWNGSQFWVVKEAASAAHTYGQRIVDAESFTGWRNWQDGPLEYKRLADVAFCAGLNRITFHTFAHNPPDSRLPGRVYHAGEHFNVNTTWWPKAAPLLSYFSRCCYMLQRGLPVADVCFYYGDGAPNLVASRRIGPGPERLDGDTCAHCGRPNPAPARALGDGYDYDVVDSNVILNRMEVKGGRLALPNGVSYSILVLPDLKTMPIAVLEKIEKLVLNGATVLGPKPSRSPSLTGYPHIDQRVRSVAERLWGECDGTKVPERSYGKGRIIWNRDRSRQILQSRNIGPDFSFVPTGGADLDYIHRRATDSDIYFVSNKLLREVEVECTFRVAGRSPKLWFPDTGEIRPCTAYDSGPNDTRLFLHLPPAGSVFVVFEGKVDKAHAPAAPAKAPQVLAQLEIDGPWDLMFPPNLGAPATAKFERLSSWTSVPEEGIHYFSGTAVYLKEIDVPETLILPGRRVTLDLGQVRNVADVTLNGKKLGILWKPPYQVDVTEAVHAGKNRLRIELTNLWANRIVGDSKLPKEKRITRLSQRLKVDGPLESGLLGPVQLRLVSQP